MQSALDGYNVAVFAYGQTGSGKTHTMVRLPLSTFIYGHFICLYQHLSIHVMIVDKHINAEAYLFNMLMF